MNSKPTEMLILAGGLGTRLKSVVSDVPKPMAQVAGRPFLAYLLDYWIGQGVRRFVISTGYLANAIESYFGNSYRTADITYVQEKFPLGTGGALRLALNSVNWQYELALMTNGDTWFPVQLQQLYADFMQQGTPITLAIKKIDKNDRYGGVAIGVDGKIQNFGERISGDSYINAGCYLLDVPVIKRV